MLPKVLVITLFIAATTLRTSKDTSIADISL